MALSTPPILITPRSHHPFSFPTAHHPSKQAPFSSSSSSISRPLQPLRLLSPPTTIFHFKCFSKAQRQSDDQVEFERLFSNLNQATLKREPGSLSSAIFLVAGTTVGAGILAIPAVTQESGFLASAVTCFLCWVYMVVTGLLIAEVNVNTMCELGSGGVSLVSMAMRTLGPVGVQIACWSYLFIHYALLVAYVARSSDILTNFLGIPIWESATLFSLVFGGICYFGSQRFIGAINGVLVFGIIISFAALVGPLLLRTRATHLMVTRGTHYHLNHPHPDTRDAPFISGLPQGSSNDTYKHKTSGRLPPHIRTASRKFKRHL